MLKNIKSKLNLKNIFICINNTAKLKLIKYNNFLQNTLNINLINYKIFSGKCIEYEKENEKRIKIHNSYNNSLLFEGEYKNFKKNGKGKEYDIYGNLIFEGEYLNGEKWNGTIKEYFDTNMKNPFKYNLSKVFSRLKFEGEYLNGEKMDMEKNMMNMVF